MRERSADAAEIVAVVPERDPKTGVVDGNAKGTSHEAEMPVGTRGTTRAGAGPEVERHV
jgi:hypothetical protein